MINFPDWLDNGMKYSVTFYVQHSCYIKPHVQPLFFFSKEENKNEKKCLKTKMPPASSQESHTKIQGKNPNLYLKNLKSKICIFLKCPIKHLSLTR